MPDLPVRTDLEQLRRQAKDLLRAAKGGDADAPRLAVGGCRLVRGPIRSSATCDEFTPRGTTEG